MANVSCKKLYNVELINNEIDSVHNSPDNNIMHNAQSYSMLDKVEQVTIIKILLHLNY